MCARQTNCQTGCNNQSAEGSVQEHNNNRQCKPMDVLLCTELQLITVLYKAAHSSYKCACTCIDIWHASLLRRSTRLRLRLSVEERREGYRHCYPLLPCISRTRLRSSCPNNPLVVLMRRSNLVDWPSCGRYWLRFWVNPAGSKKCVELLTPVGCNDCCCCRCC